MEVEDASERSPVYVEAEILKGSLANHEEIRRRVEQVLKGGSAVFSDGPITFTEDPFLASNLQSLNIVDVSTCRRATAGVVPAWQADLQIRSFQLNDEGASEEAEGDTNSCQIWMLPAKEFHGMWENLVYDSGVKRQRCSSRTGDNSQPSPISNTFSAYFEDDRKVNSNIVSWNRVVLLHGPPGTGKTSLCKALAHKLSIRLSDRYRFGQLVEVNAHSLFSKWFSESGKLVNKLFGTILELVEDPEVFVCVLIDEVESLTAARKGALSGNEPSDAIRVVNALLTQIDRLRELPNVMIMTTSNITEAIDLAFVDRADIKQYIGLPSLLARYQILRSCVMELIRVGIIRDNVSLAESEAVSRLIPSGSAAATSLAAITSSIGADDPTVQLLQCALECEGLSGRSLRKAPFLAHALFVQSKSCGWRKYCDGLLNAIRHEQTSRQQQGLAK